MSENEIGEPHRLETSVRRLSDVMSRLRADCPWDRRQTHESLRRYLIEECHEVLEALDDGDADALRGELGDLLFQVWFHAEVASEREGGFDLSDILEGVCDKLVRRHPHVYGNSEADDAGAVRRSWDRLKMAEGRTSRLDGLPPLLPALLQAQRIQEKAATCGFDWTEPAPVLDKIREEIGELEEELRAENPDIAGVAGEMGDLFFSLVNLARKLGVESEDALRLTNRKFARRFRFIEAQATEDLEDVALEEMERLWEEAKKAERPGTD